MGNPLNNGLLFLLQTLFGMYLMVVMLRLVLQWNRVDFINPVSQFVLKLTNPVVLQLRRFIPSFRRVDMAVVLFLVVVEMLKLLVLSWLQFSAVPNPLGLLLWTAGDLFALLLTVLFYGIFIRVVLSWVAPMIGRNPLFNIIYQITEPVLQPFQKIVPLIGGFDLSPIAAIIVIKLIEIVVAVPITQAGMALAFM